MDTFKEFLIKNKAQLLGVVGAFLVVGALLNVSVFDSQANLFANVKSAPFDGTTSPIKKVPDWVALTTAEWKLPYDQIPSGKLIDIPEYIPSQLATPNASLNYSRPADKAIRNAQVTFSTPYMGDYKLDGLEYAGSHLAVDIKVPSGTPVYAIANGVVVKAANEPSGFGINVVVRHDNAPSINDANTKTTYYSGYAHMSEMMVNAGDVVVKGQQIGKSGQTGTATTPHVHFQIDNDQAPWHMYWPFTGKEASDAGLGFFEAINAGLGKDKAMATTISPVAYVQKYKNDSGVVTNPVVVNIPVTNDPITSNTSTTTVTTTSSTNSSTLANLDQLPPTTNTSTVTTTATSVTAPVVVATVAPQYDHFDLKYDSAFGVGKEKSIKFIAYDVNGNLMNNFQPESEITVKLDSGSANLNKAYLNSADFFNGSANFSFTPTASFGIKLSFTYNGQTKSTEVMQDVGFNDLSVNSDEFVAVSFLKNNNIVKGYPDGTFKPGNSVSRVEALKFIYEGLHKPLLTQSNLEFSDTSSKEWYAHYVATAVQDGTVKGYAGNLFKPANSVTKAEFVKILVQAAGFNGANYVAFGKQFSDVDANAWYASYIALAKDKNLLDTSTNMFRPNQPMTRGEVADILYKTIVMTANSKNSYDSSLVVNDDLAVKFYSI